MNPLMPYKFSLLAKEDIISLQKFLISKNEEEVFPLIIKRIKQSIILLRSFPDLGEYSEIFSAKILTVPKTKYNIVYRIKNSNLEILRIYHTSLKWN